MPLFDQVRNPIGLSQGDNDNSVFYSISSIIWQLFLTLDEIAFANIVFLKNVHLPI